MAHLLVVEDEPTLRQLLTQNLQFEGFSVEAVSDGADALHRAEQGGIDLLVLDLMLPTLDGFKVLRALRESGNFVPVLMLTARGAEEDRLMGLRSGADDYLVKPFSVLELVARIRAILRRTQPQQDAPLIRSGPFLVHRHKRQAYVHGRSLNLTALEFRLMEVFCGSPGVPISREELLHLVWGSVSRPSPHTLSVHIANLRKKLQEASAPDCIVTVGRVGHGGYLWADPEPGESVSEWIGI